MMPVDILRILSPVAASYRAACMVGFIAGGLIYPLLAALRPELAEPRTLLPMLVFAGPIVGFLVTFISRRLIDIAVRLSPQLRSGLASDFDAHPVKAFLLIFGIVLLSALAVIVALRGTGGPAQAVSKCPFVHRC